MDSGTYALYLEEVVRMTREIYKPESFFVPERDSWLLSDESKDCPGVKEFKEATDYDDVIRWRANYLAKCRDCIGQPWCYASQFMQGKKARI
ncbi:MAG TPA: hypothetical protein O0X39_04175 [Methanocorpusculum sp.]|nr:hypothetical protein [Methanocorpusculum sp.]